MPEATVQDRDRLVDFLKDTLSLIAELIAEGKDRQGNRVLPTEFLPSFRAAWREFKEQFSFEQAQATIRTALNDRLVWAGLYGEQLALKLSTVANLRSRYFSLGGGKWLKKLLDAIDRLLDSLIAATGVDEALKELKDILSDNVEEET